MTAIGHIYKIICTVDEKFCYIGSTFNRLGKRFEKHRCLYKRWSDGEITKSCSCFPFFKKHGVENFKIVLIKSYEVCREHVKDRRHLEAYETLWICRTKCCNVNMPIRYLNKEQFKQRYKKYYEVNREQILERANQKIECECGCMISRAHIPRHRKTKKHIDLMASK